jgi:hypothetical protein
MAFAVSGVTRDAAGDPLGSCDVYLLKYDSGGNDFTQVDAGTSDGSGNYSLTAPDSDPSYVVIAYLDGFPVVAGITNRDLEPADTVDDDDWAAWSVAA